MRTPTSVQMRISWPVGRLDASLDDTPTSQALVKALPLVSTARIWGDEVHAAAAPGPRRRPRSRRGPAARRC
ncbi:hypothetical protein ABZ281_41165, partial [Streptomyces sp. NPDC006265]